MAYNYFSGRALFLSATPAGRRRAQVGDARVRRKLFRLVTRSPPRFVSTAAVPAIAPARRHRDTSVPFPSFLLSPPPSLSTSESRRASRQRASEMTGAAVRSGTITATITAERRDASGAHRSRAINTPEGVARRFTRDAPRR